MGGSALQIRRASGGLHQQRGLLGNGLGLHVNNNMAILCLKLKGAPPFWEAP